MTYILRVITCIEPTNPIMSKEVVHKSKCIHPLVNVNVSITANVSITVSIPYSNSR